MSEQVQNPAEEMTKEELMQQLYREYGEVSSSEGRKKTDKDLRDDYIKERLIELSKEEENIERKLQSEHLKLIKPNRS